MIEKKPFTHEEVVEAERFARRAILELTVREPRRTARKTQERDA